MRSPEFLQAEIRAAFADHAYPGDERLVDPVDGCGGAEPEQTRLYFQNKDWREVAAGDPTPLRDVLGFLSFEGFAYYLPAFLLHSFDVDDPGQPGDTVIHRLWSFPEEISSHLSPREKQATVQALEYLAGEYDAHGMERNEARWALDDYWRESEELEE